MHALKVSPEAMARAMRDNDPKYAASTYQFCDAFFEAVRLQVKERQARAARGAADVAPPPPLYRNFAGVHVGVHMYVDV